MAGQIDSINKFKFLFKLLIFLFIILGVVGVGNVVAHEVNSLKETEDFKVEITDVRLVSQTV